MARKDSEHQKKSMSLLFRGKAIFKPLNTGRIDDEYLFTGDTIWFGANGGYSFISTLAEDNKLSVESLHKLEQNIRGRNHHIALIK